MSPGAQGETDSADSAASRQLSLQNRAIELLRISDNTYLGCRDEEAGILREFIESSAERDVGGSMFVFGLSGTGKTTTVGHVISQFRQKRPDVRTALMSGSSYSSPAHLLKGLFERLAGVTGRRLRSLARPKSFRNMLDYKRMCKTIAALFASVSSYTVCVMDEVDYLRTFLWSGPEHRDSNWMLQALLSASNAPGSKVLFICISNDLELATLITERLCRILMFKPYGEQQMISLIKGKLQSLDACYKSVLNDTAILLLARRVANTSGDLRACLDTFTRAISRSMVNLEDKVVSIGSMSTASSLYSTAASSPVSSWEDSGTPKRSYTDMSRESIDVADYQVGHKEIGSLTPTLTLSKAALVTQKIQGLPLMQLLSLLAVCKSALDEGDSVVALSSVKRSLLHLADMLTLDKADVEDFCTSAFSSSFDIFKELKLVAAPRERRSDGDSLPEGECVALSVDASTLAQLILPVSPAFVGLDLEFPLDDYEGGRYSKIARSFNIRSGFKKGRRKPWWSAH